MTWFAEVLSRCSSHLFQLECEKQALSDWTKLTQCMIVSARKKTQKSFQSNPPSLNPPQPKL